MIFEPAERTLLPTNDLLSYIFHDPPYDQDKPVQFQFSDGSHPCCTLADRIDPT